MVDPTSAQRIAECGRDLAVATATAFTSPAGVHIPTMITACARMAGTFLFRSLGLQTGEAAPGDVVLSVQATEQMPLLLRTTANILQAQGVMIAREPPRLIDAPESKPQGSLLQTQAVLDPLYSVSRAKYSLSELQMAQAAAVAVGMLIHRFSKNVEANRGYGIAAVAFAEGSQTMPAPSPAPDVAA